MFLVSFSYDLQKYDLLFNIINVQENYPKW